MSTNTKKSGKKVAEPSVEEQYKKKTLHQHIIDLPDSYIGSVQTDNMNLYAFDDEENRIVRKDKNIVLGFYKIFDEILVNAADNTIRDKKCNLIKVNIDIKTGIIQVMNNGSSIPVELHKDENMYVPEMIFGNLLTSGNYDQKGKTVGGKNGFGAKCISPDTLVPLFNGQTKKANEIIIGDKLIGDDGTPRTVLKVIIGKSQMYKVDQANGESYKVNDEHILTLCQDSGDDNRTNPCGIRRNEVSERFHIPEQSFREISPEFLFDISIKDYINLDSTTKSKLTGIHGNCVQWDNKEVSIDPYILGRQLGSVLKQEGGSELLNNKCIPLEYLVNCCKTRLEVLAGIIDVAGIREMIIERIPAESEEIPYRRDSGMCIKINQEYVASDNDYHRLVNDTIYLARSIGFVCNIVNNPMDSECYINIGCGIRDIEQRKWEIGYHMNSAGSISVSSIGEGDYVGIEIDGNQRFVINDFTVTHNCANIYSTFFDVEIVDPVRNKKYYQRFKNNMFDKDEPVITSTSKGDSESYTKITFLPDYKKFGLKDLTRDMESLLKRRVYDIAGTTNSSVKVYYNDKHIDIKSFEDYIKMYYADENINLIYQDINDRWSVGVVFDNNSGFQHMSFTNRISTFQGGTHLNYIVNQIVDKVTLAITDKHKNLKIKPSQIKDNITVFINSVIEDPSFSSQTKETLTTKSSSFNVKCDIDDKFIQRLCKTGLLDEIVQVAQIKQLSELEKSDGKKNVNLKNLVKLDDARLAGTKNSSECRLILTEGDSAKSFAISGLEIIGRDKYGVFPLRGKLLNVRDATPKQLLANEEIKNLKQILGLKQNMSYSDTKKLRYGGVILLTDQDADGSHIKGLLINLFHYFWPNLLTIEGFIQSMSTPIIKVYKKSDTKKVNPEIFYTLADYNKWNTKVGESCKNYTIKYFKGLGTSTEKEAKESFTDFDKKIINYVWSLNELQSTKKLIKSKEDIYDNLDDVSKNDSADNSSSDVNMNKDEPSYQAITLAFAKQKANDRKEWLRQYKPEIIIENDIKKISFHEFVHKDLIHFSNSDNIRSIPNITDGLKPSQRKILYGTFRRKLDTEEIKVAQLSGYISEHTGYHHGEASLQGAIINMAQDFCGSNNINLLKPNGNFGSRRMGGKDSASPRYIFTQLSELTRYMYINKDEPVLEHNVEEGDIVEPNLYYPIIPTILVNGSEGIGTGFSTTIPPHNPIEIINNIKNYLNGTPFDKLTELTPWYKGFIGKIEKVNDTTFNTRGTYKIINENTIHITELPVGTWTQDYIEFLSELIEQESLINNYENNSGNHKIDIKLYFINNELQKLIKTNVLEKKLKLISIIRTSNMHIYKNNIITKYTNANSILTDYISIRLKVYDDRKKYYIQVLENEMLVLKYRKKFIEQIINKEIIIERKRKIDIIQNLIDFNYPELSHNISTKVSYDYLTTLPLFSLTMEKIDEITADFKSKFDELETYSNTDVKDIWINELNELEVVYNKWLQNYEDSNDASAKSSKVTKSKVKSGSSSKEKVRIV